MGEVDLVEPPDPLPVPLRHEAMGKLLADWLDQLGPGYFPGLRRLGDAAWLGYRIAELLPVTPERKQALLEQPDPLLVLDALERMLEQLRNPSDRD